MKSTILNTFENLEDGVRATVAVYSKGGFSIAVQDIDTGEFLPTNLIFADLEAACQAAKKCAFGR